MSGAFVSPLVKRTLSESGDPASINGSPANKRSKAQSPLVVPPGHVTFRFLCHSSRVSGIIGRGGSAIKQLQSETGSKIRIEDSLRGSDDRVIVIVAGGGVSKVMRLGESVGEEYSVSDAQEALVRVFERVLDVAAAADGVSAATLGGGSLSCRLLAEAGHTGSVIGRGGQVVERLKRESGCKIRVLSGDKLPGGIAEGDQIVEIEGGILSIKKALVSVSNCLQVCQTSMKMNNRPPESGSQPNLNRPMPDILPPHNLVLPTIARSNISCSLEVQSSADDVKKRSSVDPKTENQVIVFKILIPSARVGGVIGKGGSVIRALQDETGVTINIGPSVAGCKEQLVIITSKGTLESHYSQAQHATVLFFSRSIEARTDKLLEPGSLKSSFVTARLVVLENQVGPLLGKGGAKISELRKSTGAKIHIIRGNQVPTCASDKDEVVEISGEISNVKDALYQVTGILRDNLFPSKMTSIAGPKTSSSFLDTNIAGYRTHSSSILGSSVAVPRSTSALAFEHDISDIAQNSMASSSIYGMEILDMARNRITPPSIYNSDIPTAAGNHMISSSMYDSDILDYTARGTDSFSVYNPSIDGRLREHDSTMLHQSILGSQSLQRHSSLTENRDYPGNPYNLGLSPPSNAWASQASGLRHRGFLDIEKDLASVGGSRELGRERMSAVVTNTSVEILVSEEVIAALYGDRVSLARLREISGAKIEVHESHPGVRERTMVFSGTHDQTQAAQSLLHAFIVNGRL